MKPELSFCTWIHNRLWQYCQVLARNLHVTAGKPVEFVLLDVDSNDGLYEWLMSTGLMSQIKYVRQSQMIHTSKLKNQSHRIAISDIRVNLDADNYLGPEYCDLAMSLEPHQFLHAWSGNWSDGTCGRLAYHRTVFENFGGYDESLGPVGYDDLDLRNRLIAGGAQCVLNTNASVYGGAIDNTREQAIQSMEVESWDACNSKNVLQSRRNIEHSRLVANQP